MRCPSGEVGAVRDTTGRARRVPDRGRNAGGRARAEGGGRAAHRSPRAVRSPWSARRRDVAMRVRRLLIEMAASKWLAHRCGVTARPSDHVRSVTRRDPKWTRGDPQSGPGPTEGHDGPAGSRMNGGGGASADRRARGVGTRPGTAPVPAASAGDAPAVLCPYAFHPAASSLAAAAFAGAAAPRYRGAFLWVPAASDRRDAAGRSMTRPRPVVAEVRHGSTSHADRIESSVRKNDYP